MKPNCSVGDGRCRGVVHINGGHIQQQQGPARVRVNFDAIKNHSIEVGFAVKF